MRIWCFCCKKLVYLFLHASQRKLLFTVNHIWNNSKLLENRGYWKRSSLENFSYFEVQ